MKNKYNYLNSGVFVWLEGINARGTQKTLKSNGKKKKIDQGCRVCRLKFQRVTNMDRYRPIYDYAVICNVYLITVEFIKFVSIETL